VSRRLPRPEFSRRGSTDCARMHFTKPANLTLRAAAAVCMLEFSVE